MRASERVRLNVYEEENPRKVKALIMFLSPVTTDAPLVKRILAGAQTLDLKSSTSRAQFHRAWRMPLEAVAFHIERLERLIVIPSADRTLNDGTVQPGTHRQAAEFLSLMQKLGIEAQTLVNAAIDSGHRPEISKYASGIDFEKADNLVKAVELAYDYLLAKNIPPYDVVIDITGGQKVPTVADGKKKLRLGPLPVSVSRHHVLKAPSTKRLPAEAGRFDERERRTEVLWLTNCKLLPSDIFDPRPREIGLDTKTTVRTGPMKAKV